jgi:hypothetical protein
LWFPCAASLGLGDVFLGEEWVASGLRARQPRLSFPIYFIYETFFVRRPRGRVAYVKRKLLQASGLTKTMKYLRYLPLLFHVCTLRTPPLDIGRGERNAGPRCKRAYILLKSC